MCCPTLCWVKVSVRVHCWPWRRGSYWRGIFCCPSAGLRWPWSPNRCIISLQQTAEILRNCSLFLIVCFVYLFCLFVLVGLLLLFFWNSKTMEINCHNPTWKLFFLYLNMYKWSWFYLLFNETIFITFALVVVILHQVLAQCNTSKTLWMSLFVMGWQLTLNSNMVPYYLSSGVKLAKRIPEHTHILLYVQTKGGFQVTNTNGNTGGFSARQTSWQWPFKVLEKNH